MGRTLEANMSTPTIELVLSAIGGAASAGLTAWGVWWRARSSQRERLAELEAQRDVAMIEADASQDLSAMEILAARVTALEKHNAEQDRRIHELVIENAELRATAQLLREQNSLLREQNRRIVEEKDTLIARLVALDKGSK